MKLSLWGFKTDNVKIYALDLYKNMIKVWGIVKAECGGNGKRSVVSILVNSLISRVTFRGGLWDAGRLNVSIHWNETCPVGRELISV